MKKINKEQTARIIAKRTKKQQRRKKVVAEKRKRRYNKTNEEINSFTQQERDMYELQENRKE